MTEAAEQSNMVSKNCPACVALSLLKKSEWVALPAGIAAFLVGVSLCLAPWYFPGGGRALTILLPAFGILFFLIAFTAAQTIIWGEDYWVFYACDHEGRPIKSLHVHRQQPVLGMKPGDPTSRRYLASILTGPTDSLFAAKLGHQHSDVMEVDGPFFRLRTGWLVRSEIRSCGLRWEIVGFRIHGRLLELDVRSLTDQWSRLRLDIDQAVSLFGGRASQQNATGSDFKIHEMIMAGRHFESEKNRAATYEHLWKLAQVCLLGIGELVTDSSERSLVAQKIRNSVWTCLESAQHYCPDGPEKDRLMARHKALGEASQHWHAQHGSAPKPPGATRAKQSPKGVTTAAAAPKT